MPRLPRSPKDWPRPGPSGIASPSRPRNAVVWFRAMFARLALILLVGGVKLRPYVPPLLDPDPEPTPSAIKVVEIVPTSEDWDATVLARPLLTAPTLRPDLRTANIA